MRKLILGFLLSCVAFISQSQILRVATSPSTIVTQIPGYSEVLAINTQTFDYTPSTPDLPPSPVVDGDSTTENDLRYHYADLLTVNLNMVDGNITNTSVGKVWTLRISIPNALNIGFPFSQFNLSTTAQMYIFNEERTALDSNIMARDFSNLSSVGISPKETVSLFI